MITVTATRSLNSEVNSASLVISSQAVPSGTFRGLIVAVVMRASSSRYVTGVSWGNGSVSKIYSRTWANNSGIEFWGAIDSNLSTYTANLTVSLNNLATGYGVVTLSLSGMRQTLAELENGSTSTSILTNPDYIQYSSSPNIGDLNVIGAVGNNGSSTINTYVHDQGQTAVLNNIWTGNARAGIGYKVADNPSETVQARFANTAVDGTMNGAYITMSALGSTQPIWIN